MKRVRRKKFRKALKGYDVKEVDAHIKYLESVIKTMTKELNNE